jgi:hypothetical protein
MKYVQHLQFVFKFCPLQHVECLKHEILTFYYQLQVSICWLGLHLQAIFCDAIKFNMNNKETEAKCPHQINYTFNLFTNFDIIKRN